VIVTTHDRADWLECCVDSLLAQTFTDFEIVMVVLDATRPVEQLAARYLARDRRVRSVHCPPSVFPSTARNIGVAAANGALVLFVDDDTRAPPTLLATVVELFAQHPEADIIGGPNLTPPEDPLLAQMVGEVLGSRWGTGVTNARNRSRPAREATERDVNLSNIGIRRRLFEQGACFPDRMFCGEENALFGRARGLGRVLWYSPDLWIYHRRRSTLAGLARQTYRWGRGRAYALILARNTFHVAFFAPAGLLLAVLSLPLAGVLAPLPLSVMGLYLAGSLAAAAGICCRRRKPSWLVPLTLLFPFVHLSYGAGLLVTLLRLPFVPLTPSFGASAVGKAPEQP
jgi:GT2 family glycosyltransferase